MRVYLGSDHAGFELKRHLIDWLRAQGHEAVDVGAPSYDAADDYPPFVIRAAHRVADDPGSFGIVLGGSGNGESMAANKVPGVRAALVWNDEIATLAREHNDANVISIGARMHTHDQATGFVALFLCTPFSGDDRHSRRITQMHDYETTGAPPPLPA
ncbi:MAG: ribose-5-phosphate isomerase [Streptosporangiales bacterium]|nr:ribose-5-phosphate isomerase [Streptosporangiales bacterium]